MKVVIAAAVFDAFIAFVLRCFVVSYLSVTGNSFLYEKPLELLSLAFTSCQKIELLARVLME